ncbi:hypothetical protein PMAYCL1PPCAC_00931, partial [Pristionchus mayeri]
ADSQYALAQDTSTVFVSPGYVGCPAIPSVGDSLYTLLPNVRRIESHTAMNYTNGLTVTVNGDFNIANESDSISLRVNYDVRKLYGNNSISEMSTDSKFLMRFAWTKKNDQDTFAIQIDIASKPVPASTTRKMETTTSVSMDRLSLINIFVMPLLMLL